MTRSKFVQLLGISFYRDIIDATRPEDKYEMVVLGRLHARWCHIPLPVGLVVWLATGRWAYKSGLMED